MPRVATDDASIYYAVDGDEAGAETVAFVPEAGLGGWAWGWQQPGLAGPFATVVFDPRGTGRSDAPPGPYDRETVAGDLEAVLSDCGAGTAHVVAAGLGGAIALEAARDSTRIETLTLVGTGAREGQFDLEPLFAPPDDRDALRSSLAAGLSAEFRTEHPDVVDGIVDWRAEGDATREGWNAQLAALEGFDATDWGYEVTQPALVAHGTEDALVAPEAGHELADNLPRGEFEPLEGAGHLAFVERSRALNDRLVGFLETHGSLGFEDGQSGGGR